MINLFASTVNAAQDFLPPGLIMSIAAAFIVERSYIKCYAQEFVGTLLMISFTFSAGKWIGVDSQTVEWLSHAVGVVAADYIGGGPQVNPAVSVSMWALGKVNYTEMYVRIAAQMGGGLVAFPLFHFASESFGMVPFGGPQFDATDDEHGSAAALSEFVATMLLCFLIYAVNFELHFGPYHYWIKQPLTAFGIRYLIVMFPLAGPSMNPMLGTAWAVWNSDEGAFPSDPGHYLVYWLAPICGALLASFLYVVYAGGSFFGGPLPFGPIKGGPAPAPSAPPAETGGKKKSSKKE
eukprot:CAMPEP_0183299162 /NCGR_PEP_ID=MMETSP0160_2-20130417/5963_1 /TAXON_ID=2839 ORGANISM="Odontella Sinensis, Strain Grunow 1884" /NCGR_SAMPLE_ID=MMETSP0160_2 /ASSEMBLY_ACC=CAM_ASM_000250 /LENGTH=292 /DNA_ID=CAMNT_0025461351 /DNA_START=152 /DNA_END=1030 /DNA_ORIENTATION=-